MAEESQGPYRVTKWPKVKQQIRDLIFRARALGRKIEVVDAMHFMVHLLQTQPTEWGDPLYHTHHEGGIVYNGRHRPLVVTYAVYKAEKVVCIMDIIPYPQSGLDSTDEGP